MKKISFVVAAVLAVGMSTAASAASVTLGFNAASGGAGDQTFSESGYTVAATGGAFFDPSDNANGGLEYEKRVNSDGILTVSRATGFNFLSLDWQVEFDSPSATVSVEGFLGATSLGIDEFTSTSTTYATFFASVLDGLLLDRLVIRADRTSNSGGVFGALDAIVLGDLETTPNPIPLPASSLLLLAGVGGLAAARRRRRS